LYSFFFWTEALRSGNVLRHLVILYSLGAYRPREVEMARWMAIVALLLGVGFTAFESFNTGTSDSQRVYSMEGGSEFPPTPAPLQQSLTIR
jgi:hypothetical protein